MIRSAAFLLCLASALYCADFRSAFDKSPDRPWIGAEYWSNPLQDWRVRNGRLENHVPGGDRNVYLLTHELTGGNQPFSLQVRLGLIDPAQPAKEGFAGFRIGIRGNFKDYRDSALRGAGLNAGLTADGRLFIGTVPQDGATFDARWVDLTLRLSGAASGGAYTLRLALVGPDGRAVIETVRERVPAAWLTGGIALVSHSGPIPETPANAEMLPGFEERRHTQRGGTMRAWFSEWSVSGGKVAAHPERAFGPILFTMHTLSKGVLKLSAQLAPVGSMQQNEVHLEVRKGNDWQRLATERIDAMARTATFRVAGWDDTSDTAYRVVYEDHTWSGTVRKDPKAKPQIVVAAFTGNNDLGFPHADIVRNVAHFKPDLLAFTGDNIYERVGDYGIQREPLETATLDYLRKWYLFGWEYRELLKDIPAVALPDDHDVYHGNVWGAGGRHAEGTGYEGQDKGGYTMPADWVNMVQRTQTSAMPDPADATPVDQGITVYYTDLRIGGISFAVIEDRKWKSAPKEMLPDARIVNGWPQNPDWDSAKSGDVPGAQLLGPRQEKFLDQWATDWSGGVWMKSVISQTIFANVATLPKGANTDAITPKLVVMPVGGYAQNEAPVQDHDSNGWPQTPRMRALRSMRKGLAFHIAGDQHLGSTIQYGIDDWNDGGWAICVPSVANVWPRRWFPSEAGKNRKPGAPKYTGEFREGFGNMITVHAVSNPHAVPFEPKTLMQRAPGYGIITFDRTTRNITMANWPRWVDAAKPGARPYGGWPVTIHQTANGMPRDGKAMAAVPAAGTLIQAVNKDTGEVLYTYRTEKPNFIPIVPKSGNFEMRVLE